MSLVAPDFELQTGAAGTLRLSAVWARGPVVLVFFRGHWCPYCRRYLSKLQGHLPRIEGCGARVIAVSPEGVETSRALAAGLGLTFPILSDPTGRVIDVYGVRSRFAAAGALLPHAAVFVIDHGGAVVFRSIDRNYKRRTTVRTVLRALAEINARHAPPPPPPPSAAPA